MSNEKDKESPATTSMAYDVMSPRWRKMRALLGGTESMRNEGHEFLPQHEEESNFAYDERLASAVLLNMTSLTLESWVGRPFSDEIKLNPDVPGQVQSLLDDVDMQGNNLDVFAREWFRSGVAKGFCHVLIDMPRKAEGDLTLADDREAGTRPYAVRVEPEDLIFAHAKTINGVETLVHVRIAEWRVERDGFAEVMVQCIRQMDLTEDGVSVIIWKLQKDPHSKKEEWIAAEEFDMDVSRIPLVTFYADRDGFMLSKPPLQDLADLNIRHWQSMSDQITILTVTRFPILAVSGSTDEDDVLRIGPNEWIATPEPSAKVYYVEHTGKAIGAGKDELKSLEEQMAQYGAEFLKKRTSRETATARALDSAEATSPLQDMALRFQDAVSQMLSAMAEWLGLGSDGGTVEIARDFGPEESDQNDMVALNAARAQRDISREAYLRELIRRGILVEDFDIDGDAEKIEDETAKLMDAMNVGDENGRDSDPAPDDERGNGRGGDT